jgi:hypothetical protein
MISTTRKQYRNYDQNIVLIQSVQLIFDAICLSIWLVIYHVVSSELFIFATRFILEIKSRKGRKIFSHTPSHACIVDRYLTLNNYRGNYFLFIYRKYLYHKIQDI